MSALVTMMKKSMIGKPGYISEYPENIYIFDKCLKVQAPESTIKNVKKWVCFIEGSPVALVFDVYLSRLSTGYLQAYIYNSNCNVLPVQEVGEYSPKNTSWYVSEMYNGKLVTEKELTEICRSKVMNNSSITGDVQVHVSTPVSASTQKKTKYKENLNNMSAERLAELKRQIFG